MLRFLALLYWCPGRKREENTKYLKIFLPMGHRKVSCSRGLTWLSSHNIASNYEWFDCLAYNGKVKRYTTSLVYPFTEKYKQEGVDSMSRDPTTARGNCSIPHAVLDRIALRAGRFPATPLDFSRSPRSAPRQYLFQFWKRLRGWI